jgi:G-patch domain
MMGWNGGALGLQEKGIKECIQIKRRAEGVGVHILNLF